MKTFISSITLLIALLAPVATVSAQTPAKGEYDNTRNAPRIDAIRTFGGQVIWYNGEEWEVMSAKKKEGGLPSECRIVMRKLKQESEYEALEADLEDEVPWITVSFLEYLAGRKNAEFLDFDGILNKNGEKETDPYHVWTIDEVRMDRGKCTAVICFKDKSGNTAQCSPNCLGLKKNGTYRLMPKMEYNRLANAYGERQALSMLRHTRRKGMNEEPFTFAFGKPDSKARYGSTTQWIYKDQTGGRTWFYFNEDGKLIGWN